MDRVSVLLVLVLLQGCDGRECPPWHFTPANATTLCSECILPKMADLYCSDTGGIIDISFVMTERNYSLFIGQVLFELDRTKWLLQRSDIFTKLPPNISELEDFFCTGGKRQGFLCGQCKPGCGIAIYTYYGLPCECPCYSYGIPLYILLEIGFSTLFFVILVMINFSANSSKWITLILYFELVAHVVSTDPYTYTVLAKSGHWVPITLQSLYGIWNMDFLRLVIPRFCVSQGVSILGAISTGYISAFWPLVLVVLTSIGMHLHKRNFRIVVYPWKFVNWTLCGLVQQKFNKINLIHTFATFFLLSHLKIVYVSISLLATMRISNIYPDPTIFHASTDYSLDPYITFLSRDHLLYAVPAILVFVLIGMFLPLVLILYPTRCGTWLGGRLQSGRLRNAVRTFVEAMNGSYKDGSAGTRDYRVVPGLMLLSRGAIAACCTFRGDRFFQQSSVFVCVALVFMALTAFFGLFKPYKTTRHNLYDVLLCSLSAVECIFFFTTLSFSTSERHVEYCTAVLIFIPLTVVVIGLFKSLILKNKRA